MISTHRKTNAWRYLIKAYANVSVPLCTDRSPCRDIPDTKRKRVSHAQLPAELTDTERLVERWAAQAYDWTPRKRSILYRAIQIAAGLPLPTEASSMQDDVLLLDTRVLAKADPTVKRFCEVYYCQGGSMDQKAGRLGMGRTALYHLRKTNLEYIRERLRALGLDI